MPANENDVDMRFPTDQSIQTVFSEIAMMVRTAHEDAVTAGARSDKPSDECPHCRFQMAARNSKAWMEFEKRCVASGLLVPLVAITFGQEGISELHAMLTMVMLLGYRTGRLEATADLQAHSATA